MSHGPFDIERIDSLRQSERLSDTLRDRPAGDLFTADLEEARALARHDPRFERLAEGLAAATLGERLSAVSEFFDRFSKEDLAALQLPPHLSQLRLIYLSSNPGWLADG